MREIRALVWKEWHETRLFLWIAWGLFIGLPIVGGFEELILGARHFRFYAAPWVIAIGPLLAIVIGVAASCRDLKPKLEDFWQSRPMGNLRLFIVKYLVCICVVLLACGVPLLLEIFSNRDSSEAMVGFWLTFLTIAVFSTAFASGCVFHKTAHAAALTIAGTLLIYCLPVVFPPLSRFDVSGLLDQIGQQLLLPVRPVDNPMLPFAEGMLALAIVMGSIALAAVKFHWHIESGKPLLLGSFAAGFLVLIASASYQLGTNLPVLQQIDAPTGEIVTEILPGDGLATVFMTHVGTRSRDGVFCTRSLSNSNTSLELGPRTGLTPAAFVPIAYFPVSERDPSVWYRVGAGKEDDSSGAQLEIYHRVGSSLEWPEPTRIALWPADGKGRFTAGYPYELHDRLYIVGYRLIVFDISDPLHPRRLIDQPIQEWRPTRAPLASNNPVIRLPPAPGIPSLERLKWALRQAYTGPFDGKTWCRSGFEENEPSNFDFVVFRLKSLSDDQAEFETITQYKQTLIQRLANGERLRPIQLQNGMLYAAGERGVLDVFDVSGDGPAKLTAHFAAPGLDTFALLPDGRVIAGGSKIWVLGAPKH